MPRPTPGASPFAYTITDAAELTEHEKATMRALLADNDADDLAEMLGVQT